MRTNARRKPNGVPFARFFRARKNSDPVRSPVNEPTASVYWLTEEFYPPSIGGLEIMIARLAQALGEQGLRVEVITRQPQVPCAPRERIGAVDVRRIRPGGLLKGTGWRAVPRLAGYLLGLAWRLVIEARRYDAIIVSGAKIIPLVAVPISRVLGKRCIVRIESTAELAEPISQKSAASMGSAA